MPRCSLSRLVALAAISFLVVGCVVADGGGGDGSDAGAAADTGDGPECQRSRDCAIDERCVDGECQARQTSCGDDTDCPAGQVCRDEACVQDDRTQCAIHNECANGGEICVVAPQMQQGFCERITDQTCQDDGDCYFGGGSGYAIRGVCEGGICKGDQWFDCAIANDCAEKFNCTALQNGSSCLQPCVSNHECDRSLECNANLQHCYYNLCGRSSEVSSNFSNVNNGRLGGACRADAPAAPAPTNCVQDSDCAAMGNSARCNSDFGTCEVICDGNTDVCGTDATRDWYYCAGNDNPSVQNQPCGVGAACDGNNPCATGIACDGNDTCLTNQPCGQSSHCVGFANGETCVEGQCRSAALCDNGQCVDNNLCQQDGTCPVEACAEGYSCVADFCVDSCLTDDQCTNAGDRCTGTLDPAPQGAACDNNNACEGGAACENGRCPLPVGTETGTCEPITGTCEVIAGDGHCQEVRAGSDEQWVGLCLAGGHVPEGGTCSFDAERSEKDKWCGNGALCAVANDADTNTGTCFQGCSQIGKHGTVTCPDGTTCSNVGGYACIPDEDVCDPAQRTGCTENTKCGFFGWEEETAYCVGYGDLERKAFGEECETTTQCASGSVCLTVRTGTPDTCIPLCRTDNSVTCDGGLQCVSLSQLSRGSIAGPYGLCLQQ